MIRFDVAKGKIEGKDEHTDYESPEIHDYEIPHPSNHPTSDSYYDEVVDPVEEVIGK